jgi:hypothetical protein
MVLHNVLGALIALSALTCSLCSAPAGADVVQLEITWRQGHGVFRVGPFVHWEGRAVGELHPTEAIPDLDKAARNERALKNSRDD